MLEHGMVRTIAAPSAGSVSQVFQLGSTGTYTAATDGTNLATETVFNPAADVPYNGGMGGNNYSATTGYIKGGWNVGGVASASATHGGLRFVTGTSATFSALAVAHTYAGRGINFVDNGYTAGGGSNTGGSSYTWVNRINFSNDTNANTATALATITGSTAGVTNKANGIGYFLGGLQSSSRINHIKKFVQATETPTTLTATLSKIKNGTASGIETGTKGYMHGGYSTAALTEVETISFSTETASLTGVSMGGIIVYTSAGGSYTKFLVYKTADTTTPISVYNPATDTDTASSIALQTARSTPHACNY